MKPSIVIVGSLNMDFVVRTASLPSPGETVLGYGFEMIPGGKGANQAVAAGKLGASSVTVKMIGRVGQDLFADHLKASLAGAGVDVSAVHASRSSPTGVALIAVDANGQNQIVVASGANNDLRAADVEAMRRVLRGASVALFQLENPRETIFAALALAREEGAITILDPAPAQPLPRDLLELVDILTPNEAEALMLLGRPPGRVRIEHAPDLAAEVAELGCRRVILKLGDRGAYLHAAGEMIHSRAFEIEPQDATAAGDTFNAALAVALAEGSPMPHAKYSNRPFAAPISPSSGEFLRKRLQDSGRRLHRGSFRS